MLSLISFDLATFRGPSDSYSFNFSPRFLVSSAGILEIIYYLSALFLLTWSKSFKLSGRTLFFGSFENHANKPHNLQVLGFRLVH
jgi:hypothetical protein